jgi:hypothetical protein
MFYKLQSHQISTFDQKIYCISFFQRYVKFFFLRKLLFEVTLYYYVYKSIFVGVHLIVSFMILLHFRLLFNGVKRKKCFMNVQVSIIQLGCISMQTIISISKHYTRIALWKWIWCKEIWCNNRYIFNVTEMILI